MDSDLLHTEVADEDVKTVRMATGARRLRIPRDSATGSGTIRPPLPAALGHPFHGHSAGAVGAKRRRWGIVTRRGLAASTGGPGACAWTRP